MIDIALSNKNSQGIQKILEEKQPELQEFLQSVVTPDGEFVDYAYLTIDADATLFLAAATGYTVEFVAGGPWWNSPEGVAVDALGAIYVVQNGSHLVTRTDLGLTTFFSAGGYMSNIHDIVSYTADDTFYVTSEDWDAIVKLGPSGDQTLWCDIGDVDRPKAIDIFTDASSQPTMVVSERGNNSVAVFDPSDTAMAGRTDTIWFGGALNNPWGVTGLGSGGTDYYFTTNDGSDELWRTDNGANDDMMYDVFNGPRDVVRSPSDDLIVADSQSGIVYAVENCGGGGCASTMIAWGIWEPWGLTFESATELLVTDRNGGSLFRVTGPF